MVACDEWSTIHEWAKAFGPQTRLYASCFPVQNLKWYPLGHSRKMKITRFRTEKRLRLPLQVVPPSVGVAEFSGHSQRIPSSQPCCPANSQQDICTKNQLCARGAQRLQVPVPTTTANQFRRTMCQCGGKSRNAVSRLPHSSHHTVHCSKGAWASRQCLQLILSAY